MLFATIRAIEKFIPGVRGFVIEHSNAEIVSNSGLALIGQALHKQTRLGQSIKHTIPHRHGISNRDALFSYIGLLCIGKSDCDAIENMRESYFFSHALGVESVPSAATLRQRLDKHANRFLPLVEQVSIQFLNSITATITPLECGYVALDADVTPMDNSRTKKEGVSRTYKGTDGYAPMAGYIGAEGYCLAMELREGSQHCQKDTPEFLTRYLERASQVIDQPLLLRLDGGNDSLDNVDVVFEHNDAHPEHSGVDFLIKWNPRREDQLQWHEYAIEKAFYEEPREGMRVWVFSIDHERTRNGYDYKIRRVMRVVERSIDKRGQSLLVPDIEVEGWWTSLTLEEQKIIDLYSDHGTCEQFHSEFKTDLDIERLPSGKFATNKLVLSCAALSYNLLRWIGQTGLRGKTGPVRHKAKRRRIKTVMQELMYLACRLVESARRLKLRFSYDCPSVDIFNRLYQRLSVT